MSRRRGMVPPVMAMVPVAVVVTAMTMTVVAVTMPAPVVHLQDRRRIDHGARRDGTGGRGRRYASKAATRKQSEAEGGCDKKAAHNLLLGISEEA